MKIRVFVAGACGKMGREIVATILNQEDMQLVGAADIVNKGKDIGEVLGRKTLGVQITGSPEEKILQEAQTDIFLDFTNPQSVLGNAKTALRAGVVPVIGSTGLDKQELSELADISREKGVGCFIAPNFALGAILMMKFARETAKYFPHVEIIELHHDQKLDAPSGTAIKTAEWIAGEREAKLQGHPDEYEKYPGARGGDYEGMRIHSVRLPGLIAHQEVIFGGHGQSLTIRHDAYTRETYMPGIMLAIRKAHGLKDFIVGLEHFLD